ncbi:MAG: Nif3-like dinuclear metal center hexameric protein [Muribaculaceae bacterium]|nr:Nif3-like dinuclear metal center hexameric protein [Muribaculaceae bacterium]
MKLSYIISAIEEYAPLSLQEKWDNSGLQVGLPPEADGECTGALLCLDVTPDVIAEAVRRGCNLVVSHHPLLFKGLKRLTGRTLAERAVAAAVRAGVAVYSSHTALDSTRGGVSCEMAKLLGATPVRVLAPAACTDLLVRVTCPRAQAADVRLILLGAESAGCDYFDLDGEKANSPEAADFPENIVRHEPLCRVEARMAADAVGAAVRALRDMPGADRLRVELLALDGSSDLYGLGVVATFDSPVSMVALATLVKERFHRNCFRAGGGYDPAAKVTRIALCGGSGGEFIGMAAAAGAQVYITADVRYHDFVDNADGAMAIFDIGHFESEKCAKDIFYRVITNKFPNFAVYYSEIESNPVKYL